MEKLAKILIGLSLFIYTGVNSQNLSGDPYRVTKSLTEERAITKTQKKIYKMTLQTKRGVKKIRKRIGKVINSKKLTIDQMCSKIDQLEAEYNQIWKNYDKSVKNINDPKGF